jgi:tetratricopeptide (TPR) repeat protein
LNTYLKTPLVLLCIAVFATQICQAQLPWTKDPSNWLPDPSSGLMWAEHDYIPPYHIKWRGLKWQEASDYCSALKLDGLSGWRLPTLDEIKGIVYTRHGVVTTYADFFPTTVSCPTDISKNCDIYENKTTPPHGQLALKVDIGSDFSNLSIWTSTPSPTDEKSALVATPQITFVPILRTESQATRYSAIAALCVRPMEAEVLQIAKDAQVGVPVPDLQTLKANVPLTKARLAYQAGQYLESITQAQEALSIKPGLKTAPWGIGISYGQLGQWELAITNLKLALKIDKNYGEASDSLKWAKAGQKAAKKGEKPKIKGKEWVGPEWKGPPWN